MAQKTAPPDVFVLTTRRTFWWTIEVNQVNPDVENAHIKRRVKVEYLVVKQKEVDKMVVNPETKDIEQFLKRVVVSIDPSLTLRNSDTNEVMVNEELVAWVIDEPDFIEALVDGYAAGLMGYIPKNSQRP